LGVLNLNTQSKILEIDCGIGVISEFISDKTGAVVTGVDYASEAINIARERIAGKTHRLKFLVGDPEDLAFPDYSFDTLIAIDSFNFDYNREETLKKMTNLLQPGGQMAIFSSSMIAAQEDGTALQPGKTPPSESFRKLGLRFECYHFSDNEQVFWHRIAQFAEEMKSEFEKEGLYNFYVRSISNAEWVLIFYDRKLRCRYLYHVHKEI
jgi:ubiquinone/menaquinone biosynthesis C-methylase UbiE